MNEMKKNEGRLKVLEGLETENGGRERVSWGWRWNV